MPWRSCLKSPGPMTPDGLDSDHMHRSKSVAFCEETEVEVHVADEWDRTPAEPAQNLSYQDILELKAIQRSLPRANQLHDPYSGKLAPQYLSAVRIGLLPLLPPSDDAPSDPCTPPSTPQPYEHPEDQPRDNLNHNLNYHAHSHRVHAAVHAAEQAEQRASPAYPAYSRTPMGPMSSPSPSQPTPSQSTPYQSQSPRSPISPLSPPQSHSYQPPHLSHLMPAKPAPLRAKPTFAFLPLLDSPTTPTSAPSSTPTASNSTTRQASTPTMSPAMYETDPPTPSLTNASLSSVDSSPLSLASNASSIPEPPPFFTLPPPKKRHVGEENSYFPSNGDFLPSHIDGLSKRMGLDAVPNSSLNPPSPFALASGTATPTAALGPSGTSSQQKQNVPAPKAPPIRRKRKSIMVINDMEFEIEESDEEYESSVPTSAAPTPPRSPSPRQDSKEPEAAQKAGTSQSHEVAEMPIPPIPMPISIPAPPTPSAESSHASHPSTMSGASPMSSPLSSPSSSPTALSPLAAKLRGGGRPASPSCCGGSVRRRSPCSSPVVVPTA